MRPAEEINNLIKKINVKASANLDKRVYEDISSAQVKSAKKQATYMSPNIWSSIMKNPMIKIAAAAVIIIAVMVISFPFGKSGVAWGALVEKIENINSVVYRLKADVKMEGIPQEQMPDQESIAYYSSEYGSRSENYMNDKLSMVMYLNPKENLYLTVIPESKKYLKVTNRTQAELKQISDKDDPRVMVRHMMSEDYTELGRSKINGIEVEGIECSGPGIMGGMFEDGTARLWVEVGTDFPVRLEMEGIISGGQMEMSMVLEDFEWNVDLDPALFVPEIPSDYTSQEMQLPETNEGTAINALRLFAELTDGHYPQSLVYMSLMKELSEELTKKYGLEIMTKQDEYTSSLTDMLSASTFFTQLKAADKEVVYYGDTVTTADPEKVLLRWKVTDGVYRVVFGDLSAGNFSAEELAELEQ